MKASAIIVAAGLGKRMGESTPKQFLSLLGRPLLAHTLLPFELSESITEIILVTPEEWKEHCRRAVIEPFGYRKVARLVAGGSERQNSVYLGLKNTSADADIIIIHDGVRPLVTRAMIDDSIATAGQHGAAVVAIPLTDTLKRVGEDHMVVKTLDREKLWLAQTPQTFRKELILKAYESALSHQFYSTDDAALVEESGFPVKVVPGAITNLKVTTPDDLHLAELYLNHRKVTG